MPTARPLFENEGRLRFRCIAPNPVNNPIECLKRLNSCTRAIPRKALLKRLSSAGFNDFYIFWRGPYKSRISLGSLGTKHTQRNARLNSTNSGSSLNWCLERKSAHASGSMSNCCRKSQALDLAAAGQTQVKADLTASRCEIVDDREQPGQTLAEVSVLR